MCENPSKGSKELQNVAIHKVRKSESSLNIKGTSSESKISGIVNDIVDETTKQSQIGVNDKPQSEFTVSRIPLFKKNKFDIAAMSSSTFVATKHSWSMFPHDETPTRLPVRKRNFNNRNEDKSSEKKTCCCKKMDVQSQLATHKPKNNLDDVKTIDLDSVNCQLKLTPSQKCLLDKACTPSNHMLVQKSSNPALMITTIYTTCLLDDWRSRRGEIQQLTDELREVKDDNINARNHIKIMHSRILNEEKTNCELNKKLKHSLNEISKMKKLNDELREMCAAEQEIKRRMLEKLDQKNNELSSLHLVFMRNKSDLFRAMTVQRELQLSLAEEERKIQTLQNEKNNFLTEMYDQKYLIVSMKELYAAAMKMKNEELKKALAEIKKRKEKETPLDKDDMQISDCRNEEAQLKDQIKNLRCEINALKTGSLQSYIQRFKVNWNTGGRKGIIRFLYIAALYCAPIAANPRLDNLPIQLFISKALSLII